MVSFTLTYDRDALEAIAETIRIAPKTMQTFVEKSVPDAIRKELKPLTTEPRQPDLPFIWSYDAVKQARARRWYFANKVRGKTGGRYVRTHGLVKNWKVTAGSTQQGSIISVQNDTPGLDYVQGPRQVPSHQDSGWAQYDDVLLKAEKKANDMVIETWLSILDSKGAKFT